jgi:hypothetical protein
MAKQQQQPIITSVSDIIGVTMLPDPTVPVPFEKFAALKDSDDMLVRAAFWCFYAAWQNDKAVTTAPVAISVEARNDGHQLRAVTQQLAIRDSVLITRHDLAALNEESQDNMYRPSGALISVYVALAFLMGAVVTLWAAGIHLW